MRTLSNSALACSRRCLREYKFRYVELRRPRETGEALRFGSLIHSALEAWALEAQAGNSPEIRLGAALAVVRRANADPYEAAKAESLLIGYTARWGSESVRYYLVEAEFATHLVNPDTNTVSDVASLVGKLDGIVSVGGRMLIHEVKTTSADIGTGSYYWRTVSATDSQMSMYYKGAAALGYKVEGCLYDVLKKPALRPLGITKTRREPETPTEYGNRLLEELQANPAKYYARGEVTRLEADRLESERDTWDQAALVTEAELLGRFPRNPGSCSRYGSFCEYLPVCSGETGIDDDRLYRTAAKEHEELA